jgi:hypothetical protein
MHDILDIYAIAWLAPFNLLISLPLALACIWTLARLLRGMGLASFQPGLKTALLCLAICCIPAFTPQLFPAFAMAATALISMTGIMLLFECIPIALLRQAFPGLYSADCSIMADDQPRAHPTSKMPARLLVPLTVVHIVALVLFIILLVPIWWGEDPVTWRVSKHAFLLQTLLLTSSVALAGIIATVAIQALVLAWHRKWKGLLAAIGIILLAPLPAVISAPVAFIICPSVVAMSAPLHSWSDPLTLKLGLAEADAHRSWGESQRWLQRMHQAIEDTNDRISNKRLLIDALVERDDTWYLSIAFALLVRNNMEGADAVFLQYIDDERSVGTDQLGEVARASLMKWKEQRQLSLSPVEQQWKANHSWLY